MTAGGSCFVVAPGKGRLIDLADFEMRVKADAGSTGGVVSVLEAEYIMSLDGDEHRCPAGSFIFIPAGVPHGFRVGEVPSRKLNFYFPAAMVGYFDDLAAALTRSDVTDDELAEIAEAHHMHIVGPASERYV